MLRKDLKTTCLNVKIICQKRYSSRLAPSALGQTTISYFSDCAIRIYFNETLRKFLKYVGLQPELRMRRCHGLYSRSPCALYLHKTRKIFVLTKLHKLLTGKIAVLISELSIKFVEVTVVITSRSLSSWSIAVKRFSGVEIILSVGLFV